MSTYIHHCHGTAVQHHTSRGIQLNAPGKQCYGLFGTHLKNFQIYNSTVMAHWLQDPILIISKKGKAI